jgi:cysteinyl-tRNA synthetase
MSFKIYNTVSRTQEELVPLKDNHVRMYTCGPTVYNYAHIGNYRAYMFEDLLRRWLKYKGFKVTQVQNLTDVDDKTIRGSRETGLPLRDYTQKYKEAFFEDLKTLHIEPAEFYPAATDCIPEMIAIIEKLFAKGLAYKSDDGSVYFHKTSTTRKTPPISPSGKDMTKPTATSSGIRRGAEAAPAGTSNVPP